MANKGTPWERKVCYRLSDWWSGGRRDDIFWRSDTSGARATSRMNKGRKTFGQSGDITAVDPIGLPLIDVFSIECKKGYSRFTPFDIVDRPAKRPKEQIVEGWVNQATKACEAAGSLTYLLIWKRDGRTPVAGFDAKLFRKLDLKEVVALRRVRPYSIVGLDSKRAIAFVPFEEFLKVMTPAIVRKLARA